MLNQTRIDQYISILKEELVPALGCTEPIAIAYAAAHVRKVLGCEPDSMLIKSSGNIIKNVKGVVVPNSGGMKGMAAAAAIGAMAGNPDKGLEVLSDVTEADIEKTRRFLDTVPCKIEVLDTPATLHLIVEFSAGADSASAEIIHQHTNIVKLIKNGAVLFEKPFDPNESNAALTDRSCLSVKDIIEFANTVDLALVEPLLERQIQYNCEISEEGLKHRYGISYGANLLQFAKEDNTVSIAVKATAEAAAGSDARMSGCTLPVVTNSGSGNQGLAVSIPVIVYARELNLPHEKLLRALLVSNLIAIHQKTKIGRLSAYCGAVSAGCGSGAAITYMNGGTYKQISDTITNTLATVSGIICDGAKPSCASKIAASVNAAIASYRLAMKGEVFSAGDGIVKDNVEKTILGVGTVASEGMVATDKTILHIMVED
ncbi:L-cysteine desulfidase family protein [Treponema phagedenis]|uniref:L-cysteine desulfidase family protein n=1 Tax=Treponema phagedenis TaxID=162 RepID=UPI0001F63C38|nr:L-serine ammonia-lyase, iron-sulfur-dependent, subunit alpha [Treponema phagedenis]EFW37974.1 hypothetical protein HMPREF9554_01512 [Treponema phagedenis F0421]TYT77993.1 serine dehydratase subunit alpha family protein [Treponema phagedenis]